MRFAVLGAGAIGAYVGALLSRAGGDVTLIARGAHLKAMQEHGVRVQSPDGDFVSRPAATSEIAAVEDADAVLIGLKAYSLPGVAPELGRRLAPGAVVVGAQNGIPWWYFQQHGGELDGRVLESVDPGGVVTGAIPAERVVGCVVYCSTEIAAPGMIRHIEGNRFTLGTPGGDRTDPALAVSKAFSGAGLKAPVDRDLRRQIWLKLVGNAAFNPLTAITGATLGALGRSAHAAALARSMMEESAAVAGALGVELPISIDRRLEAGLAVGDHRTSMLQDLQAGKPLELDCMTGAVVEIADIVGVPVPTTRVVDRLAKAVEELRDG